MSVLTVSCQFTAQNTDRYKRLMQSVFSFILCNCIHVFDVSQPVHVGICQIWQLLLSDRWFYAKTVYSFIWHTACEVSKKRYEKHFLVPFTKISIFAQIQYMVCRIVLFVFSIVTWCPRLWTDPVEKHFVCVCVVL